MAWHVSIAANQHLHTPGQLHVLFLYQNIDWNRIYRDVLNILTSGGEYLLKFLLKKIKLN